MMDLAAEQIAYAQYLNTPHGVLDDEQQALHDEDTAKALANVESAWLQHGINISALPPASWRT